MSIEINTTYFSNVSDCLENIGHEFFIHASQAVKDFRDNGILDHSYLPQKLISKANKSKNSRNLAYAKAEHEYFATFDYSSRKKFISMLEESKICGNRQTITNLINEGLDRNI